MMIQTGYTARMGELKPEYRTLTSKPEGKTPSRRLRHRWEDTVKVDLKEINRARVSGRDHMA
jgi:hypothetical protein